MELNDKPMRHDGTPVIHETGKVFWGELGTNGQHAFRQLIRQGAHIVPTGFIAFANLAWPLEDGEAGVHELFSSSFSVQAKALAFGKVSEGMRAEDIPEAIVPAQALTGNRPTTSIMAASLTPCVLGELTAPYEHTIFARGAV